MRSAILRKKQLIIALIVHVLMPFVSMSAGKPMFYSDFSSMLPLVDVNYQEASSIEEGIGLVVAGCFVKSTDTTDLPNNMICTLSVYDSLVGKYYVESAPGGGGTKGVWWSHLLLALQNFPPNTYTLRAEVAYDGTSINQSRTFRGVPNNLGENYQEILESDGNIWYFTNRGGNVSAYNWFPQEAISSVGDSAMQSGLCGINGRSILQAQVTGPCIVQFDAMVAQIESGSKLRFYKNYRTQGVSPEKVWELSSQMINGTWKRFESSDIVACQPGLQEWIAWEFQRDSTKLDLCDLNAAWIDNVTRVEAIKAWFHPCGGSCDASIWVIPGKMYGEYESQVFPDAPAPPQDGRSYLFGGWYYDTTKIEKPEGGINGNMRHGDGVTPAGGVTRYSVVPKGKSSIDLYARWILVGEPHPDEELVTVSFNANGGSCSTTSRKVTKGAAVGTLPTATWSGYAFDGWYTSASGGTKVTATTKVAGNVTYYAHWTKNVTYCTVRFNANGGLCSTTSKTYASGSAIGTLPTATWDGYDFLGWYTAASGGSKVSESTVVTSDVTWYAHWQVKASTYTIQFDAGADGYWTTTANQRRTCKLNTVYALDMPNGLTGLSGKRLAGWRCSNGKRYDPGVLFFNRAQAGKSVTMTAIWDGGGGHQKEYGGVQLWEGGP